MQLVSSAQLLKAGLMSFTPTCLQKPLWGILADSILYLVILFRKIIKRKEWQLLDLLLKCEELFLQKRKPALVMDLRPQHIHGDAAETGRTQREGRN